MNTENECRNCKFYEEYIDAKRVGICRAHPPTPTMSTDGHFFPTLRFKTFWPEVDFDDWCGEWQEAQK